MAYVEILLTAISAAAATQAASALKDRLITNNERKFSLLYGALFFERYGENCATYLSDIDQYEATQGGLGQDHGALPQVPEFPDEISWSRVGIRLTEEAFAFRVQVGATQQSISFLRDFDPPDGGDAELKSALPELGLAALEIARKMRSAAKLRQPDSADQANSTAAHLARAKRESDERHAAYMAFRTAPGPLGETFIAAQPDDASQPTL